MPTRPREPSRVYLVHNYFKLILVFVGLLALLYMLFEDLRWALS